VIEYGDDGEKFYIILSGTVQISIPENPELYSNTTNMSATSMTIVKTFLRKLSFKKKKKQK